MVLVLNLLWFFIIAAACYFTARYVNNHRRRDPEVDKNKWLNRVAYIWIGVLALWMLYSTIQPSYLPKGDVKQLPNPAFEQSDATIQNNLRQPEMDSKERGEHINDRLDWKEQITND